MSIFNKTQLLTLSGDTESQVDMPEDYIKIPQAPDSFIGKKIGNCEVREKLNEGGTAYIYKAFNTSFQMMRVLKILKPSLTTNEDFYFYFVQEAQLTARLDHPNILRVFDTGVTEGQFYIEMEYIEGDTLRTLLSKKGRLTERDTLRIASQLVNALQYAHNAKIETPSGKIINGILHRDIKPENIMITHEGVVKLMDFGAAKPINMSSSAMQAMIVGTFHYMSPEQIEGRDLDARSDFFSIGIIMYELFTGIKPFLSEKLPELIDKITSSTYKPLKKIRPSISPITDELITTLLSKKPENRPASIKEINETILIAIHTFDAWALGKKAKIPLSFKKLFSTFSLIISFTALAISLFSILRTSNYFFPTDGFFTKTDGSLTSMMERGKEYENKRQWKEAMAVYSLVPTVDKGGSEDLYLEARIRLAIIALTYYNQFTKARSILEKLRLQFSDPAIDAILGQIYFKQALYQEARDRLSTALNSRKGSVIDLTDEFKSDILYYYASSLEGQYSIEKNSEILSEAAQAWDKFIAFSKCDDSSTDKKCQTALKHLQNLIDERQKVDK